MITRHRPLKKHLFILGIADNPHFPQCYTIHVMLRCNGVAEKRTAYLVSLASLPEALGDLGDLLNFWIELGWPK
ncbi:jg18572 [Pararge aegeria aegeria]|uniref:Jg18572 protein n=1 Tax=Pararge aegeria aegeria TaxID=348720 RepID=A0A8S4S2Q0_9NEOP|nr:jg18572 [Pararge aegeria aegeria]